VDVDGGGILTMWHNQIFNYIKTVEGKGFIIIIGEYKTEEGDHVVKVGVINVHSSCLNSEKMALWEEIVRIKDTNNSLARCVVGYVNAVRYPSERQGIGQERVNRSEMEGFNAFIDRSQLFDVPAVGGLLHGIDQTKLLEVS